jgi:alpha-L-rhamnosidase
MTGKAAEMIQPSISSSHDRVATDAPAPRAPHELAADGQIDARAIGERCVSTAASKTPRLSWKVASEYGPRGASFYEVEVHDSSNHRVWSSGIVASDLTEAVIGQELASHSVYNWRVRVADRDLRWSPWATSTLESGPFAYSDWQAEWLAVTQLARIVTPFRVVDPVTRARLYLTGQGVVRASVNEVTINPDRMDPTRTDFVRALYRSYDVTDLLRSGENTLSFVVGLGEWARTEESPRLLAELVMWHEDGSTSRVAPGADSAPLASEVVIDQPFYLERHDSGAAAGSVAAHAIPVALEPALLPASPATPPLDVSPDPTPPLRRVHTFAPREICCSDGSRTFDVGANIAGRSTLTVHEGVPLGTVIQVLHGEHLDADGHIDTTNLTMPYDRGRERQLVEYVSTGAADETHEPWFAYYGFRYLEVRGLPDDAEVTVAAYSMHTDLVSSGSISTDSPTIDLLLAAAQRTLLNNVHGVPEDCPTREQAAWTGDTASVAEYELAAFDSATFLDKWIADLETSQQPDGQLPAVAPDLHTTRMLSDPVWGSALHRMLLGHLLHYGDTRLTLRALPTLRRWADFQLSCTDEDGIISGSPISYGHDWLALEQTPPTIHHTAAVIDCLLALAQLEEATGDVDAAARRRASAQDLRSAARRSFFDASTGAFGNGSQGSYAVAIETGILTGTEAMDAGERLVTLIRERGNRVSSGFATTRSVVRALTMLGKSQVVFDILRQPAAPGVGAMLVSGPGTFWECWWIDPTNTGTGSLNHVGLGGPFAAWAWEGLAGIRPTAPGYTRFRIAPQFVDGVTRLSLAANTVRGEVAISYTRTASVARVEVTVPPGSEGVLAISGRADALLETGTHVVEVEVPNPIAWVPPEEATPWSPPALASASADVVGSRTILDTSELTPGRANPSLESLPRLQCMPIPHEQLGHPVLRVVAAAGGEDDGAPTVMVTPRIPLPLDGVSFVYALVDQCVEGPERGATPFLRLHLSNGQTRSSSSIAWPAGWNRVAVDTGAIDAGVEVVAMEVGLDFADNLTADSLSIYPREADIRSAFHLGEVGFSRSSRTW